MAQDNTDPQLLNSQPTRENIDMEDRRPHVGIYRSDQYISPTLTIHTQNKEDETSPAIELPRIQKRDLPRWHTSTRHYSLV
jgi:hypothetical protein